MTLNRRAFAMGAAACAAVSNATGSTARGKSKMYGLIGKMTAMEGRRDDLIAILLEGVSDMPGCLSYIVARDVEDVNAIWITEVWDSKESHENSLQLQVVQEAIAKARPMIAGMSMIATTHPVGGHGLMQD